MERQAVESKVLVSVGYEPESETLEIEFPSGKVYQYFGVPASHYEWLLRAPGKGAYFNRMIEGKYEFRRADLPPPVGAPGGLDLAEALRASLAGDDDSPTPDSDG